MTALHVDITGDCTSLLSALSNAEHAADHLAGRDYPFSITASGADAAIREVSRVSDAVAAGGGLVSVGADTRGLSDAHSGISDLRGGVQGLARDVSSLSGLNLGVGGGASIGALAGSLSGLSDSLSSAAGGMGDFSRAGESFADTGSRVSGVASRLDDGLGGASRSVSDLTSNMKELALVGAQVENSVASGGTPGGMSSRGRSGSAAGLGGPSGVGEPGSFDGPPLFPPDDWGGGGGGGRPPRPGGGRGGGLGEGGGEGLGMPLMMAGAIGAVESLATGAVGLLAVDQAIKATPDLAYAANQSMGQLSRGIREAASSAIGEGVPALHQLGSVMRNLGTEVGGVGAEHMGQAISGVSDLASSATQALKAMDPAISSSITGLVGLGESVLSGISSPSVVTGIKSVSDALSNPANEQGLTNMISGLSTVSTLVAKVAVDVGGGLGDLSGLGGAAVTPALQGGLTAGMMTKSPLVGTIAGLSILQAQQEEAAGRSDLVTPGVVGGGMGALSGSKLADQFKLTGGKKAGATAAGYVAGDLLGTGAAQLDKSAGTGGLFQDVAGGAETGFGLGMMTGDPIIAAGAALLGAAGGFAKNEFFPGSDGSDGTAASNDTGFAPGRSASDYQQAARYGWQGSTDAQGNTTIRPGAASDRASNTHLEAVRKAQGMMSGGNAMPSMAHGGPAAASSDAGTRFPGFGDMFKGSLGGPGSSGGPAPAGELQKLNQGLASAGQGAQQLTSRTNALSPSLSQVGQQANTTSSGLGQMQSRASSLGPSLQQMGQSANTTSTGMQQMQQHTAQLAPALQQVSQNATNTSLASTMLGQNVTQAAQQVQKLPASIAPTLQSLSQTSSQVSSSMSQAQSSMVSGGNQMGQQMPKSVSQGISSGQSQVCDASQSMMKGAADCASSAGGIQSPSTVFTYFGQMLGAGLAQGIAGSGGAAASAAGAQMMNVGDVARNYAADAGLNVGMTFGTNVISGLNTTITANQMKATGLAQGLNSPLAKVALGQLGLLGVAGSGAQSWNLTSTQPGQIGFGGGTPANSTPQTIPTPQVHVQVQINNAIESYVTQVNTQNFEQLAAALAGTRR